MKIILVMLTIATICFSCGKKEDPEYKSLNYNNNTIQKI